MRKGLAGLCGLCVMGSLLAWIPAPRANARVGVVDKQLLGVRLLQSYKQVLQLYGQPTRIYRTNESVVFLPATDANGRDTGGVKGLGDSTDNGGGGAMPGGGAVGGSPSSAGGGGGANQTGGGVLAPPPNAVRKGGGSPGSGGFPGSGGSPGSGGFPGSDGGALGGATSSSEKPETFAEAGGFIWVYFYPRDELAYEFVFNGDNRCIAVKERGRYKGLPSERGLRLGDPASKVYSTYGWPDSVEQQTNLMVLYFNLRHHAQISLLNGKVVDIAVVLRESLQFRTVGAGSGGAGGPSAVPGGFPGSGGGGKRSGAGGPGGAD